MLQQYCMLLQSCCSTHLFHFIVHETITLRFKQLCVAPWFSGQVVRTAVCCPPPEYRVKTATKSTFKRRGAALESVWRNIRCKLRHKKGVNIPEVPGNNHNQNRTNLQSQITSTKKITSSTGTRPRSSPVSQTRLQGGFTRQSRSDRRVENRDEGPTIWATYATICCSLWQSLAEDSKQQFEEDSSCCRKVIENLVSY